MRIIIKPFSVNQAWKGKLLKSDRYKSYEEYLLYTLPKLNVPEGKLEIHLEFGFRTSASDVDNPIKPFLDILQKKYDFNDNKVYRIIVDKKVVKKGKEYVDFNIYSYKY